MRLLADENLPVQDIACLREAGHDVVSIAESAPGILDRAVLERAGLERRIVITFDLDFGQIIFGSDPPSVPGVVLVREAYDDPGELGVVLVDLFARPDLHFEGFFSVIERNRVRQRRIGA